VLEIRYQPDYRRFAPIIPLEANPGGNADKKALLDAMFECLSVAAFEIKIGPDKIYTEFAIARGMPDYTEVYHANFRPEFAILGYLFGTIYDPGHAPRKPAGKLERIAPIIPKDYFLQLMRFPSSV